MTQSPTCRPRTGSTLAALLLGGLVTSLAAALVDSWPASPDRPVVEEPADYGAVAAAVSDGGELYVALSKVENSGSVGVTILRSLDDGFTYQPYGSFVDANPEHNYFAPAFAMATNGSGGEQLVLVLLEQVALEWRVLVARTPNNPIPDWQVTPIASGDWLVDPEIAVDRREDGRVYLIYRSVVIDGGFDVRLAFARSTDGGATWSAPVEIGETSFPDEMTSSAIAAAPGEVVHVAWVASGMDGGWIVHRRHLRGGDPGQSFESEQVIVGSGLDASRVRLAAGDGPEVLAAYLAGDGALRAAWSPDSGATFPRDQEILVAAIESPDELRMVAEGYGVDLVYRREGARLAHRSVDLTAPSSPTNLSWVSDLGEPASSVSLALRPGSGPAAVWFRIEGELKRPFLDAAWFPTGIADEPVPGATPARLRAFPNPFTARTAIELEIERAVEQVRVAVYSASGRLARVVHQGPLPVGRVRFMWDGRNAAGQELPAGVYYVTASFPAGGVVQTRAVMVR